MRAHYFQHEPFEGLGSIESWLRAHGAAITDTQCYAPDAVWPSLDEVDFLILMGGAMSVNDEAALPWLVREKDFVRDAIARGIPVLGVCLGAQMIASALGAKVYKNREKEIGWFPIIRVAEAPDACFAFPEETKVFHWHGETFDLPQGASHLARSSGCEHQAFQVGRNVIGLQFHLETTPDSARALVKECPEDLAPGRYVQNADAILATPAAQYDAINQLMNEILGYLATSKT